MEKFGPTQQLIIDTLRARRNKAMTNLQLSEQTEKEVGPLRQAILVLKRKGVIKPEDELVKGGHTRRKWLLTSAYYDEAVDYGFKRHDEVPLQEWEKDLLSGNYPPPVAGAERPKVPIFSDNNEKSKTSQIIADRKGIPAQQNREYVEQLTKTTGLTYDTPVATAKPEPKKVTISDNYRAGYGDGFDVGFKKAVELMRAGFIDWT